MSSNPRRTSVSAASGTVPFASYAQVARMLVPLANKVSFYDAQGNALWLSDGMEGVELRKHVDLLLARPDVAAVSDRSVAYTASEDADRIYIFTIDDEAGTMLGAMGLVCRDMANATHGSSKTIARLLQPLIEILRHGWRVAAAESPQAAATPLRKIIEAPREPEAHDPAVADLSPLAALRRMLAVSTQRLDCAFGAVIGARPGFTLSHRVSRDESDLTINAAIDNVRAHMFKWLNVRSEPVIVNTVTPGRADFSPFKFFVLPLKVSGDLAGLIVLFRGKHDRNFTHDDVEVLRKAVARLPERVLARLAPDPTVQPSPERGQARATSAREETPSRQAPSAPRAPAPSAQAPSLTPTPSVTMDERIRAALRDDNFGLFAQRICALRDSHRAGRFEVLLRMRDGPRVHLPRTFFAAAEAGKLMPEVDGWVIRSLLRSLRHNASRVRASGWEFCINLAAQSLTTPGFVEFLVAEVCKSAVPPGLLVFEVSESNAFDHTDAVGVLAARLRDVGCRIALDNCRAGLGTLGPLRDWPVSCVKIDGSLTREILGSARSESVVRAVAQLAGHRGIETVAECVESEQVRQKLADIGIDFAQGFCIDQPQALANIFR